MVVGVWRQSFERAPQYRRGRRSVWGGAVHSGFYRSAGMSDRKPRGAGNDSIRLPSGGGLFRPLTLRPFGRALSGWFRKIFFRSPFRVSSSHLKAVRMGFVRVVSKDFFRSPFRVSSSRFKAVWTGLVRRNLEKLFEAACASPLSPYKWHRVDFGSTCSKKNLWTR